MSRSPPRPYFTHLFYRETPLSPSRGVSRPFFCLAPTCCIATIPSGRLFATSTPRSTLGVYFHPWELPNAFCPSLRRSHLSADAGQSRLRCPSNRANDSRTFTIFSRSSDSVTWRVVISRLRCDSSLAISARRGISFSSIRLSTRISRRNHPTSAVIAINSAAMVPAGRKYRAVGVTLSPFKTFPNPRRPSRRRSASGRRS